MPHTFKNMCKDQRGIVIPLLAIFAAVVVTILIGLGFDSAKVKKASTLLSEKTESICMKAAERAVVQEEAAALFSEQINQTVRIGIPEATIISAKLVLPTMPADGSFCRYKDSNCAQSSAAPYLAGSEGTSFASLGINACNFNCTAAAERCHTDCLFQGDVQNDADYPAQIWSNQWNAGNTASCEIKAEVKTYFGIRSIEARSTWWTPVRGEFQINSYSDTDMGDVPGLTIAIAPHMTTDAADPRFRFCSKDEANCGSSGPAGRAEYPGGDLAFRSRYDPLFGYNPGIKPAAFNQPQPEIADPSSAKVLSSPATISANCLSDPDGDEDCSNSQSRDVPSLNQYGELSGCNSPFQTSSGGGASCLKVSDREQMLAACMNPAVLLRNTLLATIVEYASRHGQLRRGTELLMTGTQSRYLDSGATDLGPRALNHPVAMLPFGADLVSKRFQLPFVTYEAGINDENAYGVQMPAEMRAGQGRMIDPYKNSGATDLEREPRMEQHHALIASQLRYCYHLFFDDQIADQGIQRLAPDGFAESSSATFNQQFEPRSAYQVPVEKNLRNRAFGASTDVWDQETPWNNASFNNLRTRSLNASELMASLGTIQKCPYEQAGLPEPFASLSSGVCKKPSTPMLAWQNDNSDVMPSNDLRPDLLGTLYYLAAQNPPAAPTYRDASGAQIQPRGPQLALNAPGLFNLNYLSTPPAAPLSAVAGNPYLPYGHNNYQANPNTGTAILLFTHQRLNDDEVSNIRALIDADSFKGRPITVIYMPVEEMDKNAHKLAVEDFWHAFKIDPNGTSADSGSQNALFVLSPYIFRYNETEWGGSDAPPSNYNGSAASNQEWKRYRAYWKDLLSSETENIHIIARNIFFSRILREDINF